MKSATQYSHDRFVDEVHTWDPSKDERWDKFVMGHPLGWISHLSGWKSVIESTFPHIQAHYFAVTDGETGEIKAGLPLYEVRSWLTGNRLVSIPFATISDVLTDSNDDSIALLNQAKELLNALNLSYITINTRANPQTLSSEAGFIHTSNYKLHYLNLTDGIDALWKNMHPKTIRSHIIKAEKRKLQFRVGTKMEELKFFYKLYAMTRRRLGLPAQPYKFFEALFRIFFPSKNVALHMAYMDGSPVAAHLLFKFGSQVSAETAGEDPAQRKLSPSRFLNWEGIKLACSEGYKTFDFGRTSVLSKALLDSKRSWGTSEADLHSISYRQNGSSKQLSDSGTSYKLVHFICRTFPAIFQPMISNFCYRHLG